MKLIRIFTGLDGESHFERRDLVFADEGKFGAFTALEKTDGVIFIRREPSFIDFHPAPRRQYVVYLSTTVEIGVGDGSSVVMEPGDVLLAEDTTGRGHTSRVKEGGVCAFIMLEA